MMARGTSKGRLAATPLLKFVLNREKDRELVQAEFGFTSIAIYAFNVDGKGNVLASVDGQLRLIVADFGLIADVISGRGRERYFRPEVVR